MTSRHYRLPSLHALATFEATARHGSLRKAADELNVTTGAVSRQIKALEDELGTALLDRAQTGHGLTADGELLFAVLRETFGRLGDTVGVIRLGNRQQQVTVACSHAFARCWLMPRMSAFWRDNPDICVNHRISDDGRDYKRSEVDLRIRYGFGAWSDETAIKLFDDVIYPVASPDFARRHADATAADLSRLPLLHVDWADPDWTDWDEFLRRGGVERGTAAGRRFSNFDVALQACKDGQGVALGWHRLVERVVAAGDLVRVTELTIPAPGAYYLSFNASLLPKGATATFLNWLMDAAALPAQPPPA